MIKKLSGAALVLSLALFLAPAPAAAAVTCASCGITSSNLWQWQAIDPSGNGTLTTFDLVLFQKLVNFQGGFCIVFQEDLGYYYSGQYDIDGDGSWDIDDQRIINAANDLFYIKGNPTSLNFCDMIECLRTIILGTCP
jgi:hypothetical protein